MKFYSTYEATERHSHVNAKQSTSEKVQKYRARDGKGLQADRGVKSSKGFDIII